VVVGPGLGVRFDSHRARPQLLGAAAGGCDRRGAGHATCLRGVAVELVAANDADPICAPVGRQAVSISWADRRKRTQCAGRSRRFQARRDCRAHRVSGRGGCCHGCCHGPSSAGPAEGRPSKRKQLSRAIRPRCQAAAAIAALSLSWIEITSSSRVSVKIRGDGRAAAHRLERARAVLARAPRVATNARDGSSASDGSHRPRRVPDPSRRYAGKPRLSGAPSSAPERTRTSTDHKVHKALNRVARV